MEAIEFEKIKNKIKTAELNSATAKGKIESIESNWQKKYGFTSLEDAKKKRDEIKKEISEKTETRNNLMDKLENSYNWNSLM